MHDLHGGVHSSISAAGGDDFNLVIGDDRETLLDHGLNAAGMVLRLPTGKVTTVVFEAESDSRH